MQDVAATDGESHSGDEAGALEAAPARRCRGGGGGPAVGGLPWRGAQPAGTQESEDLLQKPLDSFGLAIFGRAKAPALILLMALMLALTALLLRATWRGRATNADATLSLAMEVWRDSSDTFCENFEDIKLEGRNATGMRECIIDCQKEVLCTAVLFRREPSFWHLTQPDGTFVSGASMCYLLKGDCDETPGAGLDFTLSVRPSVPQKIVADATPDEWNRIKGVGCGNWRGISIFDATRGASLDQCKVKCKETLGCSAINFQAKPCKDGEGAGRGACLLLATASERCQKEENACWDLHELTSPVPKLPSSTYRTGCSNFRKLALEPVSKQWSKYACWNRCAQLSGCKAFNHQPGNCVGGEQIGINYCWLFEAGCNSEKNTCWDLYVLPTET